MKTMSLLGLIVLGSFIIESCTKESIDKANVSSNTTPSYSMEEMMNVLLKKEIKDKEKGIMYVSFKKNEKNKFSILEIKETKMSDKTVERIEFFNGFYRMLQSQEINSTSDNSNNPPPPNRTYVISCSGASGGDWEKSSDNSAGAIKLAADCLNSGGCANVCAGRIAVTLDEINNVSTIFVNPNNDVFE